MAKYEIEATKVDIEINGISFEFDASADNINKLIGQDGIKDEYRVKIEEKSEALKGIDFDSETFDDIDYELPALVDFLKALAEYEYDTLLGEGAFDKLYPIINDAQAMLDNFEPLVDAIANEMDSALNSRRKKLENLQKKKARKKNK
jgi:hypothetical protein